MYPMWDKNQHSLPRKATLFYVLVIIAATLVIPLEQTAQADTLDFAIPIYQVYDGICGQLLCGNFLGQHGPDNLTGDNTKSTSVEIEISPEYNANGQGGTEVPLTGILCSLDNAIPAPCNTDSQRAEYTNLAIGQHFFKAILVTAFGNDPNPPVFTWKIIGNPPPPPPHLTLGQQLTQNTWLQLCKNPTVFNSIQGRMHCIR